MSANKPYKKPWSWKWFLARPAYKRFMVREATSVAVLLYVCIFLSILAKLGKGDLAEFTACVDALKSPFWYLLNLLLLGGALYHSITWFNLTPKALPGKPFQFGEKKLGPGALAVLAGYGPWATVSLIIWIVWSVLV
ncbi:MAG: hypothetical protein GC159_18300 [Phycisphaera sp.]|nr:hypothetical protein [Phycisphaera sp.]